MAIPPTNSMILELRGSEGTLATGTLDLTCFALSILKGSTDFDLLGEITPESFESSEFFAREFPRSGVVVPIRITEAMPMSRILSINFRRQSPPILSFKYSSYTLSKKMACFK